MLITSDHYPCPLWKIASIESMIRYQPITSSSTVTINMKPVVVRFVFDVESARTSKYLSFIEFDVFTIEMVKRTYCRLSCVIEWLPRKKCKTHQASLLQAVTYIMDAIRL